MRLSVSYIKNILHLDMVKVFSLNALATLVKMFTSLVSVKVVASVIGPAGVALVGQLNNFVTIATSLSSAGVNNGITKYVAESRQNSDEVKNYLSNALRIIFYCSLFIGLCLIVFHRFLSLKIMLAPSYGYVFIIFGITILLYGLNTLLVSIVNGYKEFKTFARISIVGSLVGLVFTVTLVLFFNLNGALISAVTFQSLMFFITLFFVRRMPWLNLCWFKKQLNRPIVKKLMGYTLMTLTSVAVVPVSQMLLRAYVIINISPTEAGWWEAMNRVSGMYLMVITSSFSVYYLPRLSEIKDDALLHSEILRAFKLIVPIMIICFPLIYLFRVLVIKILFTSEFMPMKDLFLWQLIGDFFKICSWLLAFLMLAKSMVKAYIFTEILFSFTFIFFSFIFLNKNGLIGITQGYCLNYFIYLLAMICLFRRVIFCS
jgi:PST family polysaccharide transporter